ncbi:hypothetical protein IEQ34_022913 [Dendrobium chrysotoxum]|uniref:Uncharacterized protein n=1 Tax=Dendrobium chrysotoxum TaxID=161865 RepID=A0AAV7G086_DENCH|nr:hypothetical protein IEQ34_022913 [Dendrobium chrysotoxum]
MLLPYKYHFFDRHILHLRKEQPNECCHYDNKTNKEVEESELHVAKHVKEQLSDYECEEHVHRHIDALSS